MAACCKAGALPETAVSLRNCNCKAGRGSSKQWDNPKTTGKDAFPKKSKLSASLKTQNRRSAVNSKVWTLSVVTQKENHKGKKLTQLGLPFLPLAWNAWMPAVPQTRPFQMQQSNSHSVIPQLWPLQHKAQRGTTAKNRPWVKWALSSR